MFVLIVLQFAKLLVQTCQLPAHFWKIFFSQIALHLGKAVDFNAFPVFFALAKLTQLLFSNA